MDSDATPPILCIGLAPCLQRTLTFRKLEAGHVNRTADVVQTPAGKGVNSALVVKALNGHPIVTGLLGGGSGETVRFMLAEREIEMAFLETETPTRICQTLIDAEKSQATELVEEMAPTTADIWEALLARIDELMPRCSLATVSGTLPPGAPETMYLEIGRLAARHEVPLLIDSQQRPLLAALAEKPLMAKLNEEEMAATLGSEIGADTAHRLESCRRLIERGAQNVVLTAGRDGAYLVEADRAWRLPPPRMSIINPIGSGDAVMGGIAHAVVQGQALVDAVKLGVAMGSANALTRVPGEVHITEAYKILAEIDCREV